MANIATLFEMKDKSLSVFSSLCHGAYKLLGEPQETAPPLCLCGFIKKQKTLIYFRIAIANSYWLLGSISYDRITSEDLYCSLIL